MAKAIWNGAVIAESDVVVPLEGYVYFPAEAVKKEFLKASDYHTVCHWKGTASYYDVVVDGKVNKNAAWYYPSPSPAATKFITSGHVGFWRGVATEK